MKAHRINPNLVLTVGVIGISCSAIFVKYSEAPAVITATYRLLWTVLLLTPSALWTHRAEWRQVTGRDMGWCGLSGFFLALHFVSWFLSLKYTSVASSSALMSTEVIFTAFGFVIFLQGTLYRKAWVCILTAFAGSVMIALADGVGTGGALFGDLLSLAGAVCVSGYSLIGRRQRDHLSNTLYTYLTYSSCVVFLLLMDGLSGTPVTGWGARELLIGFLLAFFCTLLGHSLCNWCLKYLNPAYVAAAKLCEPVVSSVLAAVLFLEIPSGIQLAGAIVLLVGVFSYANLERKQTAPGEEKTGKGEKND